VLGVFGWGGCRTVRTRRIEASYEEIATVGIQKQDAFPRNDILYFDI